MARDPNQVAADWAQRLAGSTTKMQQGAQSVQTAPGVLAARQANVWAQNTAAAQQKFARNVQAVSLADWQQAYVQKGLPRVAQGAQQAQDKYAASMGRLLPYIDAGVRGLPPRGNFQQNVQRMVAMATHMANYNRTGTGA